LNKMLKSSPAQLSVAVMALLGVASPMKLSQISTNKQINNI